ncbi:MAG: hypothetical protein IT429_19990, partial [Gemmataceae bacterium]|nr:hypothetical protein [Gemmataceae bacterium]
RQVAALQVGDLAVYWNDEGGVVHTGVVCAAGEKGPVLVQSKWGDLGCFIHTPDGHHYGPVVCRYYRSPRRGHILRGLAGGPTDKPPAPTAPRGTPPILAPQLVGE